MNRTFGTAVADDARRLHRIDDYALSNRHAPHSVADCGHLTGGLVAQRHNTVTGAIDPALFDVGKIATANTAGLDPHYNIMITDPWRIARIQTDVAHAVNIQHAHRCIPF